MNICVWRHLTESSTFAHELNCLIYHVAASKQIPKDKRRSNKWCRHVVRGSDYVAVLSSFLTSRWLNYTSFTPCPPAFLLFSASSHTQPKHTNTVYYAVTLPDPLRQLCIFVWLMRVISPKQQNDHFAVEHYRPSLFSLSFLLTVNDEADEMKTFFATNVSCSVLDGLRYLKSVN